MKGWKGLDQRVSLAAGEEKTVTGTILLPGARLWSPEEPALYVDDAFKPLGVYLNFWQPKRKPEESRTFTDMMVNDGSQAASGDLALTLEGANGEVVARPQQKFSIPALGAET